MNKKLDSKVKELRELKRMLEDVQAEIDAIQDEIKNEMSSQGVDVLSGSDWKVTWKDVYTSRVDSKALRAAMPDVAEQYTAKTVSKRFVLS